MSIRGLRITDRPQFCDFQEASVTNLSFEAHIIYFSWCTYKRKFIRVCTSVSNQPQKRNERIKDSNDLSGGRFTRIQIEYSRPFSRYWLLRNNSKNNRGLSCLHFVVWQELRNSHRRWTRLNECSAVPTLHAGTSWDCHLTFEIIVNVSWK